VFINIVTDLHGMVEVYCASFLEVQLLPWNATESNDQAVHDHNWFNSDVVPDILKMLHDGGEQSAGGLSLIHGYY
jgi:uncharacterized membrane protein